MNDLDAPNAIELIVQALKNCTDADLLDLIYKLLVCAESAE